MDQKVSSGGRNGEPRRGTNTPDGPKRQVRAPVTEAYRGFASTERKSETSGGVERLCKICGGETGWAGNGRPREYCDKHNPRQGAAAKGPVADQPQPQLDTETQELMRAVAMLAPDEPEDGLLTLEVEDHLQIDALGHVAALEVRQRVRATRDGVSAYLFKHYAETAQVQPIRGCAAHRVDAALKPNRWVQPLTFTDGPLSEGEERLIVYKLIHREPSQNSEFPGSHQRQVRDNVLQKLTMVLRFDAPARVQRCRWQELKGEPAVMGKPSQEFRREFKLLWTPPIEPGFYYGVRWVMAAAGCLN